MIGASLRYFSGRLADRTRAYWPLTIAGYVLNLAAVPLMAFAGNWQIAALLVVAERSGKSLRTPARDVLLSEATGAVGHGWGFGLHTAMDQTGAVAGPLFVAMAVARSLHYGRAFLWLAVPAVCAWIALAWARAAYPSAGASAPQTVAHQDLSKTFWFYTAAAALLAFGFVDFPLLAFHFQKTSLFPQTTIPLLYSLAMAVNGLTALAFGKLFDRIGTAALALGIAIALVALPLGFFGGPTLAVIAVACWGAGMGAQDACLRSGIARAVSMDKRGTAFGAFYGVFGVAWFAGSSVMGVLYGISLPLLVACGVAAELVSLAMFLRLPGNQPPVK
jgi:MFS family permease